MKPNQVTQSQVELWLNDPVTKSFQYHCNDWALHIWDNIPNKQIEAKSNEEAMNAVNLELGKRLMLLAVADTENFLHDFDAIKEEAA